MGLRVGIIVIIPRQNEKLMSWSSMGYWFNIKEKEKGTGKERACIGTMGK